MNPMPNVEIEAICIDCSTPHKQEAVSEHDGTYRISKLWPNSTYHLRIQNKKLLIAKSLPEFIDASIKEWDIGSIDFIVMNRPRVFEIAG